MLTFENSLILFIIFMFCFIISIDLYFNDIMLLDIIITY